MLKDNKVEVESLPREAIVTKQPPVPKSVVQKKPTKAPKIREVEKIPEVEDIFYADQGTNLEKGVYYVAGLSPKSLRAGIKLDEIRSKQIDSTIRDQVDKMSEAYDSKYLTKEQKESRDERRRQFEFCIKDAQKI